MDDESLYMIAFTGFRSVPSSLAAFVAMAANNPYHPALPVELIYQILGETWRLPLSTTERHDLLVSLPLVCMSFRWITSRLFLQDAHLVCPSYATHLLSLLQ